MKLKNKTRAVAVYALAGGQAYAESEDFKRLSSLHGEMLTSYRARKFNAAKALAVAAEPLAPRKSPACTFIISGGSPIWPIWSWMSPGRR